MRSPGAVQRRESFRFNITPMIDVVFLLIIFFLVASYFIRSEQSRAVTLPDAARGVSGREQSTEHLTVTLEPDGTLSIAGQVCSTDTIQQRIEAFADNARQNKAEIRIRADRSARYGEIRKLIELCSASQVRSIRFAVTAQRK